MKLFSVTYMFILISVMAWDQNINVVCGNKIEVPNTNSYSLRELKFSFP